MVSEVLYSRLHFFFLPFVWTPKLQTFSKNTPTKGKKWTVFNREWTTNDFFTEVQSSAVLIWQETVMVFREYNISRHFTTRSSEVKIIYLWLFWLVVYLSSHQQSICLLLPPIPRQILEPVLTQQSSSLLIIAVCKMKNKVFATKNTDNNWLDV